MRFSLTVYLLFMFSIAGAYADMQAKDTFLFVDVNGRLCQMVHVTGVTDPVGAWKLDAAGSVSDLAARDVRPHKDGWLVPVPAVDRPTEVTIAAGQSGSIAHTVKPQKRWTAYLAPHTHFDLGFTDVQSKVWDQQMDYLHGVISTCEETKDWPRDAQYRWTIECSSLLEEFADRFPADMPKLVDLVRQGRVEVAGAYVGLLTELCGGEELCRSLYPVQRFRDRYGISITTAMHNDIPGITWQMAQLFPAAGIEYLSFRANSIRGKFLWDRVEAPTRPFIWEGPDGSKLMVWYTDSYREANFFRDDLPKDTPSDVIAASIGGPFNQFLELIARQERKGTPADAIQMRMGGDNMSPTINPCKWARAWNERWAYPRIIVATNRMFFDHVERFRPQLETHRGDITDWWADGAGSSARETGINRVNHERAALAETMGALLGVDLGDTWDLYRNMLLYDEHTFGSSEGLRERQPQNNAEQWRTKSGFAYGASRQSRSILRAGSDSLAESVRAGDVTRLVVWNPSSWARDGVVEVSLPDGWSVYDPATGKHLPVERVGDRSALSVDGIPALGWKAYLVKPGQSAAPPAVESSLGELPAIGYIYDLGGKREKVVPISKMPHYEKVRSAAEIVPVRASSATRGGPANPPGVKSVHATTAPFAGPERTDIVVDINKVATEEREAVYLEFPFDLKDPTVHAGVPFGWMNAASDRLPCTCADYFSMDRAVDLNDGRRGVTLAAVEAPLVAFGEITTDTWSEKLDAANGSIYSYVMNNYWYTNYQFSQGGPHTFRYAVRQYEGPFDPLAASRFGAEVARPLQARVVSPGTPGRWAEATSWSAIQVRPENVMIEVAKRAEDGRGIILRLVECAGKSADVHISTPGLGKGTLWKCTLLEKDTQRLGPSDGTTSFRMGPWQIATIRIGQ